MTHSLVLALALIAPASSGAARPADATALQVGATATSSAAGAPTAGAPTQTAMDSAALSDSVVRVSKQLRCPVCQQLSIQDSPADLAKEMRKEVHRRLAAGESEEQVLAYFVSKYGEWILLDPPKHGSNLVVWLVPWAVLLGGGGVLAVAFSRWLRAPAGEAVGGEGGRPA
jgi:cytochrome c-type biogenesis protein CcmH